MRYIFATCWELGLGGLPGRRFAVMKLKSGSIGPSSMPTCHPLIYSHIHTVPLSATFLGLDTVNATWRLFMWYPVLARMWFEYKYHVIKLMTGSSKSRSPLTTATLTLLGHPLGSSFVFLLVGTPRLARVRSFSFLELAWVLFNIY
jgi:hypothetical protein